MRSFFVLSAIILIGCNDEENAIPNCNEGDFNCGEGLECTSQLTLEGERYGCTPIDIQEEPPVNVASEPTEMIAGMMASDAPMAGSGGDPGAKEEDISMSDFVPSEEDAVCATDAQEQGTINRQTAQECFEIFECFNEEDCDQFMMLEEERECIRSCITAASPPAQIAFSNFANCVRVNCITTAGELLDDQCIIDNCFYQADACNLIVREDK